MKLLAIGLAGVALAGCAPRTLAALVPRLDLQLRMGKRRAEQAVIAQPDAEQGYVVLGAWLRWEPSWSTPPTTLSSSVALLGPCDPADAACLDEQVAVADALTEAR